MDMWSDPRRRWIGWVVLAAGFVLFSFHRVSTSVLADPVTWVHGVVFLAFVGTTFTVLRIPTEELPITRRIGMQH